MDDIDFSLPVGELGAYLWRHGCAAGGHRATTRKATDEVKVGFAAAAAEPQRV